MKVGPNRLLEMAERSIALMPWRRRWVTGNQGPFELVNDVGAGLLILHGRTLSVRIFPREVNPCHEYGRYRWSNER
ncbi:MULTISPECIES: hypothetical protein [Kitasatospora]|uniref:hypothetical protein n=1 Tax=Kitasatospora TaxID=2063 RepID=UPI001180011A|nr:hypothetical protein [Kitasatospora sp. GP30]